MEDKGGEGRERRKAGEGDPRARSYRLHSCDGHRQVSFWGHWKILNDETLFTQLFIY